MPDETLRPALVLHARDSIARGSKSFRTASRLFDRTTRERAWLLYAWCRACDDIADGQDHGGTMHATDDSRVRLADIQDRTERALAGKAGLDDPAFAGVALVAAEVALPRRYMDDLIGGFALDAAGWRPRTQGDLMRYCYHVAGAVGCMMAIVMGVAPDDEATLTRACDLGLAFQLANIARDIAEDAAAGRCYLPSDWLAEAGIDAADPMAPATRPALAVLAGRVAGLAARYEESARRGTPALPFRCAWAVLAAAGIYGGIARHVAADPAAALTARVHTSKWEKLGWLMQAAGQSASRHRLYPDTPRDPALWQRPASTGA
ncbi:phytoene/squalene synthase family protein [Sphingobium nicotianae]|uniref:Phytoene/squalene synthase family protein n=1 Tax=Sphingobium nicotianae TaxID=2782607 RepID=A0A9X1D9U4_9SPHN|nr:phytoene/squalene synthase family protein [Sphingobium nicotianae]MBT2185990.1 phytoene/squalene synthase family protein [Sphingobium nicotianae]